MQYLNHIKDGTWKFRGHICLCNLLDQKLQGTEVRSGEFRFYYRYYIVGALQLIFLRICLRSVSFVLGIIEQDFITIVLVCCYSYQYLGSIAFILFNVYCTSSLHCRNHGHEVVEQDDAAIDKQQSCEL